MRAGLAALRNSQASEETKELKQSAAESSAPIVTYANDEARLNNFILTLLGLQGRRLSDAELAQLQNILQRHGYASTETRLSASGIERTTRSAFGQFGTFVSLLQTEPSTR
jgi:hypothetical protein